MKKKLPALPEVFERRINDFIADDHPFRRIPPIIALKCETILSAYHGSTMKAAIAMLLKELRHKKESALARARMWVAEKMGWVICRHHPETSESYEHYAYHGKHCSYLNCDDMDCVDRSIPKWFKVLSGWKDLKDL
jgi:hypothetical protein